MHMAHTEGPYGVEHDLWGWIAPILLDGAFGEAAQPCADPSPPQDVRALVQTLKESEDLRLTSLVLLKLSGVKHATVIQLLTRFRSHSSEMVRWTAVEGLSRIGNREALAALLPSLEDGDPRVQARARQLLTESDPGTLQALLDAGLGSEQPAHREEAARAMARLGLPGFEANIAFLLDDPNAQVKRLALELLRDHAGAEIVPALEAKARELGPSVVTDELIATIRTIQDRVADPLDALAMMAGEVPGLAPAGAPAEPPPDEGDEVDPFGGLAEVVAAHRPDPAPGPAAAQDAAPVEEEDPFVAIARMKREKEERERRFLEEHEAHPEDEGGEFEDPMEQSAGGADAQDGDPLDDDPLAALADEAGEDGESEETRENLAALAAKVQILGRPTEAPPRLTPVDAFDHSLDFALESAPPPVTETGADVNAATAALFPPDAAMAGEEVEAAPSSADQDLGPLGDLDPLAALGEPPGLTTRPAPPPAADHKMDLDASDLLAQMAGGSELSLSQLPGASPRQGGPMTTPSPPPFPATSYPEADLAGAPEVVSTPDLSLDSAIAAPITAPASPPTAPEPPPPPPPAAAPRAPAAEPRTPKEWLDQLLEHLVVQGGSDLHLQEGQPPRLRKDDQLRNVNDTPIEHGRLQQALSSLVTGEVFARYLETGDLDFAHGRRGLARFRCNYLQCGGLPAAVFRVVPNRLPSLVEIGVPDVVTELLDRTSGIILLSGAAGAGKTTTLNALVDVVNASRSAHVVCIEDPIEFLHADKLGSVTQREVGSDTESFEVGVRAAARMDPDVLMLGDIPDGATFKAALEASAAGRLVLAAVAARNVEQALENLGALLEPEERLRLLPALASELLAVVSQVLVPREAEGRVAAFEVMLCNLEVKGRIRAAERHWVRPLLRKYRKAGMRTLEDSLLERIQKGDIDSRQALLRASEPQDLARMLEEEAE